LPSSITILLFSFDDDYKVVVVGGRGVTSSCILSRTFEKQKWRIGSYLGRGPFGHVFAMGIKYRTSISKTQGEQKISNYK